ncbi:MAG: type I-B CRISPR-associated protein Cas7/Csh2 [Thermoproteota archaeon]|jgi:CRISPR-associated protein Csh2
MSNKNELIKNRSEILFLYDVKFTNPNGDPMEENRPRIDEETGINIITDVRLKRTIRDYILEYEHKSGDNFDIFIKEELKEDGKLKTREEKLEELKVSSQKDAEKLLEKHVDLRLFGATIAAAKGEGQKGEKVFTWIGPVQFRFGRSLHRVTPMLVKGTSVLPSAEKKAAGTFTETWVVPYSLICFYGIVNENNATKTGLTENDVNLMYKALWNGTKNLITRSKFGQMPRLLLVVTYEEKNYHIGDLDRLVKIDASKKDEELRDISELKINITDLIRTLVNEKSKIKKVSIEVDNNVSLVHEEKEYKGMEGLKGLLQEKGLPVFCMNINV